MTTQDAINATIAKRAKEIVEYIEMGMELDWAIAQVKNSSTLGPTAWAQVLALVSGQANA